MAARSAGCSATCRPPHFGRKELDLLPSVCAATVPPAGASQVPETKAEIADCERVVQFMRSWLVGPRVAPAPRDIPRLIASRDRATERVGSVGCRHVGGVTVEALS